MELKHEKQTPQRQLDSQQSRRSSLQCDSNKVSNIVDASDALHEMSEIDDGDNHGCFQTLYDGNGAEKFSSIHTLVHLNKPDARCGDKIKGDGIAYFWRCCWCSEGLFELPFLGQGEGTKRWEGKCVGTDCYHIKCDMCMVYQRKKNSAWVTNWEVYPPSLFIRGTEPESITFQIGISEPMLGIFTDHYAASPQASTPGYTTGSTTATGSSPLPLLDGNSSTHLATDLQPRVCEIKVAIKEKLSQIRSQILTRQGTKGNSLTGTNFEFLILWEHAIVPFLSELLPIYCGPGFAISINCSEGKYARTIEILTEEEAGECARTAIREETSDLLSSESTGLLDFSFGTGTIERMMHDLDARSDPQNPYCYDHPIMGDSIGLVVGQGDDDGTSTLGPCISIAKESYWLMNFHPLHQAAGQRSQGYIGLKVQHPSESDWLEYASDGNESSRDKTIIGSVKCSSGADWKATVLSQNPYWEEMFMEPQSIVVDWALITSGRANVNRSRVPVLHRGRFDEKKITQISGIIPGASVYSTGRTSGRQCGKVCMSPAVISGKMNGTGKTTREWYVEKRDHTDSDAIWAESGIGISGDSGAGIVGSQTHTLIGQLWGRNKCHRNQTGPRKTFFTPMPDILDDIQAKFSRDIRPTLPTVEQETSNSCLTPRLVQSSTEEKTPMEYEPPTPEMALWTSHMTGGTFKFSAPSPWPQISVPTPVSDADSMASPYALRIDPGDCVDGENGNHAMLKRGADTDPSPGDRDMEKRRRVE